jgi:O-methyltransferase involved in polyketide biosynthesis
MAEKIKIQLGKVQETLLLPLWGRAVETQKKSPRLIDYKALEIIETIDYDFSIISKNINPLVQYAWVARCHHFDGIIRKFLESHPSGTIMNIGCGMDTTFERIDNGKVRFYDFDLPDVISLRKNFFQETDRRHLMTGSLLDTGWFKEIDFSGGIMFLIAGVLYYFEAAQVKQFFLSLADYFHHYEAVFDSASPLGVKASNKKVLESGGMDKSAVLKWGIKTSSEIAAWDNRIEILSEFPMYTNMKKGFPLNMKFAFWISDILKIMSIIHIKVK